jgi:MFS family permease
MFCTGAIVQTFFLQIGLNEQQVYLYNSLIQAAQVVMMVLMIFISPRIKKVKLVTGLSYLSLTAIAVILFVAAVAPSAVNELYIIIIFAISVLCNLGVGIYMVLAYCIPYYTIDMSNYGRFISLQMVFTGAGTFAFSSLHTFVISKFDYLPSMACFFAFSILLFMMASFFCLSMKEKKDV